MPVTIGTKIGSYEIKSRLGEGGMGVVFRARDSKLQRDVALKLLPDDFAEDPDRLMRFQREAQVLASLNHHNIAQIYGLEESNRKQCIVMELVEGETLSERLKLGPQPVRESLVIVHQIAEALEAAHEKGIIHRDLKPANIKLTPDGKVKVLDFGLAKAFDADASDPDISNSPTLMNVSAAGMIIGTASYMSPEQARGKPVDRRTDIWALGCILYELLTGRRAFAGETVTDTAAAILKNTPDWNALPAEASSRIRHVLERCLQKDPSQRVQHAGDLRLEIQELLSPAGRDDAAMKAADARRRWFVAVVASLLAIVAGVILWNVFGPAGKPAAGPPVVVLMDSPLPERVYDPETRKQGGTNADDISDILVDLPIELHKETTSPLWHREHQIALQNPTLIVLHKSAFADAIPAGTDADPLWVELRDTRVIAFLAYVSSVTPKPKFLVYSRRGWIDAADAKRWISELEKRFPPLAGRLTVMNVPLDRATFRNPQTGSEIKSLVKSILGIH
jgi:tRNA A-37 threonylcarbamoyl transferase component Bud32